MLGEPVGLVYDEPSDSDVDREAGTGVVEDQSGADVHAGPGFRVAAVLPDAHLDARGERHAVSDRQGVRPFQRRAQPVHRRVGCGEPSAGTVDRRRVRSDPQGVSLECQAEAVAVAEDLPPASAGYHGHRQPGLDGRSSPGVEQQAARPVAGHGPHGGSVAGLVADPGERPVTADVIRSVSTLA